MQETIFSQSQAAEYLGISYELLKYYRRRGGVKAKKYGLQWIYLKEDLDKFRNRKK